MSNKSLNKSTLSLLLRGNERMYIMIKYAIKLLILCSLTSVYAETNSDIKSRIQNALNGISSILKTKEHEIFGGFYFQNEPDFKVKLLVTDLSEKDRLIGYVNAKVKNKIDQSQLLTFLDIVEVKYSYAALQVIRKEYEEELKNNGIRFDSYTSVKENKIVFRILYDKQNSKSVSEIVAVSAKENSAIKLELMSKLSEPYGNSYGVKP
jgi:hypothetical protein